MFGSEGCRKLLCAWHIDRSWRQALQDSVPSSSRRIEMYYNLIVPLQEREKAAFRVTLQKFLSFATDRKPKFATYFNTTYCSRALCSLLQTPNSCKHKHVPGETFHRLLKVIYLHHKQNRRLDHLLVTFNENSKRHSI